LELLFGILNKNILWIGHMKINYARGLDEESAKFWSNRVGWDPSEVSEKIAQENKPKKHVMLLTSAGTMKRDAL
jgi:hypothetical protein